MSFSQSNNIRIVFFQRKARKFNYSLEFIFDAVRKNLPSDFTGIYRPARFYSNGFFKRLLITVQAAFNQGDVNHVTGDIHFANLFLKKEKSMLTILDVGLLQNCSGLKREVLKFFWITLPVKRAKMITTISKSAKEELLKHTSCDPNKIRVVYVPISENFIAEPKSFNKEKPVILQIGTKANKNIDRLIEALRGINCHLEIVGPLSNDQLEKLAEYKLDYKVSTNLSTEEIVQKYIDCDILAFVSTYEGFGMPIVEANATGRVVLTSNILSMPEIAGDAAHLVDPLSIEGIREGFLKVIGNDDYRNKLIQNGYKNRRRFTIREITNEYCDIYRELAQ